MLAALWFMQMQWLIFLFEGFHGNNLLLFVTGKFASLLWGVCLTTCKAFIRSWCLRYFCNVTDSFNMKRLVFIHVLSEPFVANMSTLWGGKIFPTSNETFWIPRGTDTTRELNCKRIKPRDPLPTPSSQLHIGVGTVMFCNTKAFMYRPVRKLCEKIEILPRVVSAIYPSAPNYVF